MSVIIEVDPSNYSYLDINTQHSNDNIDRKWSELIQKVIDKLDDMKESNEILIEVDDVTDEAIEDAMMQYLEETIKEEVGDWIQAAN